MSIELRNLKKSWRQKGEPDRDILNLPEFNANPGQHVCLVGHSGSGKTTLLNILAGIVKPTSGQVLIGGTDIAQLGESSRDLFRAQNIGYVFQTFNLLQGLSALENVMVAATFAGMPSKQVKPRAFELLHRVGLAQRKNAKPGQMSVGEQQRVAIARALVNKPQLVLADEPTANLDQENGEDVLKLLRETTAEAESILLLVTHDAYVQSQFEDVRQLSEINA